MDDRTVVGTNTVSDETALRGLYQQPMELAILKQLDRLDASHCGDLSEEPSFAKGPISMVKPTVKSGFVGDVTLTFTIRMKGKTPGCRSRSSSLASEGSVWQPGVAACFGFEVSKPAMSTAARASRSTHTGWPGAALRRLIAEVVAGDVGCGLVVSPAAPSSLFVGVPSGFAGTAPSVFAGALCFRALKQSRRSVRCSIARQRATSSFVAALAIPILTVARTYHATKAVPKHLT
jgi:hypothetical protein